jgi:2-methylcitrate dehydratase PrpD
MGKVKQQSITQIFGEFVSGLSYEKLPTDVTQRAKNVILDFIGTAIEGRNLPYSLIALKLARSSLGNSTIFTHHQKAASADAAFVNAVMGAVLAQDDAMFTFHPGVVNVTAAVAVAEQEQGTGAELIVAVVAGYDIMGRALLGAGPIRSAFRDGSVFGPFGAAAASAKLLKLNSDQTADALGLAANMGGGLRQWVLGGFKERDIFDPMGARNGVIAATLAKEGISAAAETLEGRRGFYQAFAGTSEKAETAIEELGERFMIMEARYKPYPVCWLTQAPIEMSIGLAAKHQIKPTDIAEITARLSYANATHAGSDDAGPFVNATQPLLSNQFAVAAAFLGKPVGSYRLYYEHYDDAEVGALAKKVRVIGEKDRMIPKIEVKLLDGKEYVAEMNPQEEFVPTEQNILGKFRKHVNDTIGKSRAEEIAEVVLNLDKVKNVRDLTEKLW